MDEDTTAYESLDRRGTVITTQGPIFHDQQPRNTPIPNDPDSDNEFIPLSPEEETSPSLIKNESAISSSPCTSPSVIGHDDGTLPPRAGPTENEQDSRTPATSNKQNKAAHNESNQVRLSQQSNRTTQGLEDDIDIDEIATRTKGSTQTEEQHRSQTGRNCLLPAVFATELPILFLLIVV